MSFNCAVCLREITLSYAKPSGCNHKEFCSECLKKVEEIAINNDLKPKCPICRTEFEFVSYFFHVISNVFV